MNNLKEISVEVLKRICKKCGYQFDIYVLPDFVYGEKLLKTEDGLDYIYINCLEDTTFDEVGRIVDKYFSKKKKSQQFITDCFDKIFGLTCDLFNGKKIDAYRSKYPCIKCGSEIFETFDYEPPKITNITIPVVTHNTWEQKSPSEKEKIIFNALNEIKC